MRWYTVSAAAVLASSGISCTAVAPVPMIATRLPASSTESSQAAVWITLPWNDSMPAMPGVFGWERKPVAVTRYRAVTVSPLSTVTCQWSSCHTARVAAVPKRIDSRKPYLSATCSA